jgi:hypothetical protein
MVGEPGQRERHVGQLVELDGRQRARRRRDRHQLAGAFGIVLGRHATAGSLRLPLAESYEQLVILAAAVFICCQAA